MVPPGAFLRCLRAAQFWAVGVQYFFLVMIQSFYSTWLPTYLVTERHSRWKRWASMPRCPGSRCSSRSSLTGGLAT